MDINKLLGRLKEENGVAEEKPQTAAPATGLGEGIIKIQQVLTGGNKQLLKNWLTKLSGRRIDAKLVKELKQMIAENVTAVDFIEKLFQMIENQSTKIRA